MSGVISQDDFDRLQDELIKLKQYKYEQSEREKRFVNEIKNQKEQIEELKRNDGASKTTLSKPSSLFSDIMAKTKGAAGKMNDLTEENEQLKRTIMENTIVYKEQSEALQLNVKTMFENNKQLEDEILMLKKDIQQYIIKGDDQQTKIKKLNVDMAELHCSKEELENQLNDVKIQFQQQIQQLQQQQTLQSIVINNGEQSDQQSPDDTNSNNNNNNDGEVNGDNSTDQPTILLSNLNTPSSLSSSIQNLIQSITLDNLLALVNPDQEELKEKLQDVFKVVKDIQQHHQQSQQLQIPLSPMTPSLLSSPLLSNNNSTVNSPMLSSKKEIIFHPLGEPTYNPNEEKEKQNLRETIKSLMEQVKESEQKTTKVIEQSKQYEVQIEQLTTQLTQAQDKHKQAEINRVKIEEKLTGDIKKLENDITLLNAEKEEMHSEKGDIEASIQLSSQKFQDTITTMQQNLQNDKQNYLIQLNEKVQEIQDLKIKISDLNDNLNIIKVSRDETLDNYKTSQQDIQIKDKLIEAKVQDIGQLKEEVKKLQEEVKEQKQIVQKKVEEVNGGKSTITELEEKLKKNEEKLTRESSNFYSMTDQFNKLNSSKSLVEEKNKEIESENKKLQEENKQLTSEQERLIGENVALKEERMSQDTVMGEQSDKIIELNEDLERSTVELEDRSKEMSLLKNVMETMEKERSEHVQELEKLRPLVKELESLNSQHIEAMDKVSKLEVLLADSETERRIEEKKNTKLIKDLKSELSKERTSLNLLTQSSGSIPSTPNQTPLSASSNNIKLNASLNGQSLPSTPITTPVKSHNRTMSRGGEPFLSSAGSSQATLNVPQLQQSLQQHQQSLQQQSNISNSNSNSIPTSPNMQPQQLSSGGMSRSNSTTFMRGNTSSNNLNQYGSSNNVDALKSDIEVLGRKLGEFGNEKYKLEEKVRTLEQNVLILNQELDKKNKVVRFYISKTQLGKATTTDEKSKRLKGGALGSFWRNNDPHLVGEMVEKMEVMLQENILKNIQLSDDVEVLGNEASRLTSENKAIKLLLQKHGLDIPNPEQFFTNVDQKNQPSTPNISSLGGGSTNNLSSSLLSSVGETTDEMDDEDDDVR